MLYLILFLVVLIILAFVIRNARSSSVNVQESNHLPATNQTTGASFKSTPQLKPSTQQFEPIKSSELSASESNAIVPSGRVHKGVESGSISGFNYRIHHSDSSGAILSQNTGSSVWNFRVNNFQGVQSVTISNEKLTLALNEGISMIIRGDSYFDTCGGDFWCSDELNTLESGDLFANQIKSLYHSKHTDLSAFKAALQLAAHIYSHVNNGATFVSSLIEQLEGKTPATSARVKTSRTSFVVDEELLANALYLDTETTGLEDDRQVVEIAVVDAKCKTLFHSRIKPTIEIGERSSRIHGITANTVAGSPSFSDISEEFLSLIKGRTVVGYNVEFDVQAIVNSASATGASLSVAETTDFVCAMDYATQLFKRERYQKLTDLCRAFDISTEGAHTSLADARMTALLLQKLFEINESNSDLLALYDNIDPVALAECKEGEQLRYFESKYGMGVVAKWQWRLAHVVGDNLEQIRHFEDELGGEVRYYVRKEGRLLPDIEQVFVTANELTQEEEARRAERQQSLREKLLKDNAFPRKGKLIRTFSWHTFSAPQNIEIGQTYSISSLSLEELLAGDLELKILNDQNEIVGSQYLLSDWVRIAGIITSGYSVAVTVLHKTQDNNPKIKAELSFIKETL